MTRYVSTAKAAPESVQCHENSGDRAGVREHGSSFTGCPCVLQRFQRLPRRKQGLDDGDDRFSKLQTDKRFATGGWKGKSKFNKGAQPAASAASESSSSSSSSDDDSEDEDALLEGEAGALGRDKEVVPTGDETKRLAVMNCDWDHLNSTDLLFVLQVWRGCSGSVPWVSECQDGVFCDLVLAVVPAAQRRHQVCDRVPI